MIDRCNKAEIDLHQLITSLHEAEKDNTYGAWYDVFYLAHCLSEDMNHLSLLAMKSANRIIIEAINKTVQECAKVLRGGHV